MGGGGGASTSWELLRTRGLAEPAAAGSALPTTRLQVRLLARPPSCWGSEACWLGDWAAAAAAGAGSAALQRVIRSTAGCLLGLDPVPEAERADWGAGRTAGSALAAAGCR